MNLEKKSNFFAFHIICQYILPDAAINLLHQNKITQ